MIIAAMLKKSEPIDSRVIEANFIKKLLQYGKGGLSVQLGLILNIARTSEDLYPRIRIRASGWKITRRKHQGEGRMVAKLM